ncbi:MAG: hypothetical protein IJS68_04070, partial [Clostridia bacterium]|nr:hypothetical protein [Clostridia bacterium]
GHNKNTKREIHFMVNYDAPLLLMRALCDKFSPTGARIICLIPNFNHKHLWWYAKRGFKYAYYKSKFDLANYFLSNHDMLGNTHVYLYVPKRATTDFFLKNTIGYENKQGRFLRYFSLPPEYSAEQIVLLSTRPELEEPTCHFYSGLSAVKTPKVFLRKPLKHV